MAVQALTPILNVSSVTESQAWFAQFGWSPGFTWPEGAEATFGAVSGGKVEIFLCKGAQGSRGTQSPRFPGDDAIDGVWMSWWVGSKAEVDALHARALEVGATVTWPPTDEPWGVREFHLRHPNGHTFRVGCGSDDDGHDD